MIRKNKWITKQELENIKRKVLQKEKHIEVNSNDNTGERFYQDEENIHENEATHVDTENLGEEEKIMIQDISDLMKENSRIELMGNEEPYHKPSYNQSMPFPDLYVSSYSNAVSFYQLIIDLWPLYFFPCILFAQLVAYYSHQENFKYFQQ